MLLIAASMSSAVGRPGRPTVPVAEVDRVVLDAGAGNWRGELSDERLLLEDEGAV